MISGTPKWAIQPLNRAAAQSVAVMEERGIASGHRVDLSTTVNRYVKPWEGGSGPTKSTWMCEKRLSGTVMGAAFT
jgi:hypothetical protein